MVVKTRYVTLPTENKRTVVPPESTETTATFVSVTVVCYRNVAAAAKVDVWQQLKIVDARLTGPFLAIFQLVFLMRVIFFNFMGIYDAVQTLVTQTCIQIPNLEAG